MEVADIASHVNLPARQVRYLLEYDLAPDTRHACRGRGVVRQFSPEEAVTLACGSLLHTAGLRGSVLRGCLRRVRDTARSGDKVSARTLDVEIGDGRNIRVKAEEVSKADDSLFDGAADGRWFDALTDQPLAPEYQPAVVTRLNLSGLRRRFGL